MQDALAVGDVLGLGLGELLFVDDFALKGDISLGFVEFLYDFTEVDFLLKIFFDFDFVMS